MSNTSTRKADRERDHRRHWLYGITTAGAVGLITVLAISTSGGGSAGSSVAASTATNSMGMPIIATPGTQSGVAEGDGISGTPSLWALGRVGLNTAVQPTWTLQNTGTDTVTVGEPHVQVNEGCCPGALTYTGPTTLDPSQSTSLMFELSMHPGMDGAHDMTIHVPVQHADGTSSVLDLSITGDFRD
jgi:hypothetical protein